MLKILIVVLLVVAPISLSADIYRHEDEEGVVHFTDAPQASDRDKWKVFAKNPEKKKNGKAPQTAPKPVPVKYIYREISPADGMVYAVKTTSVPGTYYWYMGPYGDYLATCKNSKILLGNGIATVGLKNKEVVYETVLSRSVWLDGTIGYEMYNVTIRHAVTR